MNLRLFCILIDRIPGFLERLNLIILKVLVFPLFSLLIQIYSYEIEGENLYKSSRPFLVMKKRGSSHTEMILAFIIFVAAVGLALFLFSPGSAGRDVNTYLTYSFTEIMRKTNVDLEVFSVNISGGLINENQIALEIPGVEGNTRVSTYEGISLASYKAEVSDFVNIDKGSNNWADIDFVYVYFSDDFDQGSEIVGFHNVSYYKISTSYEKEVLSEKEFKTLVNEHNTDYDALKEEFNLKIGIGFSLVFEDGEIVAENEIPTGLEVYSDSRRVEVLRESGEIVFADLNVWVW
jgi:hypothetical protein